MSNAIAVRVTPAQSLLEKNAASLEAVLPASVKVEAERYVRMALAVAGDNALDSCEPMSVVRSIFGAGKLGLSLDRSLGQAYIVPRRVKGKEGKFATLQVGYLGWIELAYRSNTVAALHAEVVYANDEFEEWLGSDRRLIHRRWDRLGQPQPGEMIYAYCTWIDTRSKTAEFHRVNGERIQRALKSSESAKSDYSPWRSDEVAMWKKTAILDAHRLWKLTPEMALAGRLDDHAEKGEEQPELPKVTSGEAQDATPERSELSDYDQETEPATETT